MDAFDQLAQTLESSVKHYQVFFRDDDGGWADSRLQSLCDCFGQMAVPLDIALIPDALTSSTVTLLRALLSDSSALFHMHQHGFAHVNHQTQGRSCEFGSERDFAHQFDDIAQGQQILHDHLESSAEPIFTPPWNRCTTATKRALEQLGFRALSRITGSEPLSGNLVELPVAVDWLKKKHGVRLEAEDIILQITTQFKSEQPVIGIMLHHEHMDRENRALLTRTVNVLQQSKRVRFVSMLDTLIPDTDQHHGVTP